MGIQLVFPLMFRPAQEMNLCLSTLSLFIPQGNDRFTNSINMGDEVAEQPSLYIPLDYGHTV